MEKKKIGVLIVDDDCQFGASLKSYLEQEGFRVTHVLSPEEALPEIKRRSYNFVLLDMKLPKMKGEDLLADIRKQDSDISIIVITAYPSLDSAICATRHGVDDYLRKPFRMSQLLEVMEKIIKKKGIFADPEKQLILQIGSRLRSLRQKKKLTLQQLGKKSGLSASLISKIELGDSSASISTLYKLSAALGVHIDYFFKKD